MKQNEENDMEKMHQNKGCEKEKLETQQLKNEQIENQGQIVLDQSKHKIHLLSIIGEIEGHEVSSPQTKQPNMNTFFHSWQQLRIMMKLTVSLYC